MLIYLHVTKDPWAFSWLRGIHTAYILLVFAKTMYDSSAILPI